MQGGSHFEVSVNMFMTVLFFYTSELSESLHMETQTWFSILEAQNGDGLEVFHSLLCQIYSLF